jgi:hypothetical protein
MTSKQQETFLMSPECNELQRACPQKMNMVIVFVAMVKVCWLQVGLAALNFFAQDFLRIQIWSLLIPSHIRQQK